MKAPSSRRALLAGLAVAPFVAAPVAASLADIEAHPDAELLALEPKFLALNTALGDARAEADRIDELVQERIGPFPTEHTVAASRAWGDKAKPIKAELGWDDAEAVVDDAYQAAWAVVDRIIAIGPVTLDGLQMKARVLKAFELDARDDILDEILAVRSTGRV